MYIYKITNLITNKIYIGQVYNKSVQDRFNRHIHDAKENSHSYIDRSIAKYGADNFIVETIDTANDLTELNYKEKYWIKYYNSTDRSIGYNLTSGGDGENTYLCKSKEELSEIKYKISVANSGKNNGQSKGVKCRNEKTGEILHFDTLTLALQYFNIKNKGFISSRCNKETNCLYKNTWNFAWENEDFLELNIFDPSTRKGTSIKTINIKTKEELVFPSINKLCKYLGYSSKLSLQTLQEKYKNDYIIEKIN